jgi:hypothetical protein
MSDAKKVSCVLCAGRPTLVPQAIALFSALEWPSKELVLVEDAGSEYAGTVPAGTVRKSVPVGTLLGVKTQAGVEAATGEVLHKMDDDDYYAPGFLARAVAEIEKGMDLVWCRRHLIYFAATDATRLISDSMVGGSFVFTAALAKLIGFQPIAKAIDEAFFIDAKNIGSKFRPIVDSPGLFIRVRHGGNIWKTFDLPTAHGGSCTLTVDQLLIYKSVAYAGSGMPAADRQVYQQYQREVASANTH